MDFNQDLRDAFWASLDITQNDIPPLGYNCTEETRENFLKFMSSYYEDLLNKERIQNGVYVKWIEKLPIWDIIKIKWNSLWRKRQITT